MIRARGRGRGGGRAALERHDDEIMPRRRGRLKRVAVTVESNLQLVRICSGIADLLTPRRRDFPNDSSVPFGDQLVRRRTVNA